jgi:hypothetical protein
MQKTVRITRLRGKKRDTEEIEIRGVGMSPDGTAWIYFLDDGTGCNMKVPIKDFCRDPKDTPVEVVFIPADRAYRAETDKRDDKEVMRAHREACAARRAVVFFSDGSKADAGYPTFYERLVEEQKDFLALKGETMAEADVTLPEKVLFKIAMECPKLDERTRKKPGHWPVFLAAWKDRMTPYDMKRQKKWNRQTAQHRLTTIEKELLNGQKIKNIRFESSLLNSVEGQIEAGRKHGAKVFRPALLDNTKDNDTDD